jgi:hypothetical protein
LITPSKGKKAGYFVVLKQVFTKKVSFPGQRSRAVGFLNHYKAAGSEKTTNCGCESTSVSIGGGWRLEAGG